MGSKMSKNRSVPSKNILLISFYLKRYQDKKIKNISRRVKAHKVAIIMLPSEN